MEKQLGPFTVTPGQEADMLYLSGDVEANRCLIHVSVSAKPWGSEEIHYSYPYWYARRADGRALTQNQSGKVHAILRDALATLSREDVQAFEAARTNQNDSAMYNAVGEAIKELIRFHDTLTGDIIRPEPLGPAAFREVLARLRDAQYAIEKVNKEAIEREQAAYYAKREAEFTARHG